MAWLKKEEDNTTQSELTKQQIQLHRLHRQQQPLHHHRVWWHGTWRRWEGREASYPSQGAAAAASVCPVLVMANGTAAWSEFTSPTRLTAS